jgi:hypothetical protein
MMKNARGTGANTVIDVRYDETGGSVVDYGMGLRQPFIDHVTAGCPEIVRERLLTR